MNPRGHEWNFTWCFSLEKIFRSKINQVPVSIANCNMVNDTYLSQKKKKKKKHDMQDMCKTISHAVNACSFKYKLCFVLIWISGKESIYERDVK